MQTCDECKKPNNVLYACDKSMKALCETCSVKSECYLQPHEEGCETVIFQDDEP